MIDCIFTSLLELMVIITESLDFISVSIYSHFCDLPHEELKCLEYDF
jgi:hypothetical protein